MSIISTVSYIIGMLLVALTTAFLTYKQDSEMLHDYRERLMELRSDHDKTLLEKAEIEKNSLTLEQINAGLLADNARLTAERDAAKAQQKEPELQASESNESALSSQSDDVLQTDATKPKERLPEGHTNVISGMPYTTITDKKSEQWALQLQAFTGKYGIRCYFGGDHIYFLAAMGSAYGRTIGDAFRVTLKCGTVMYVMLGEFKDDGTDPNFFGHPTTHADGYDVTCVLEFIYNAEHINSKALQAGNFCNIECFGGLHGYGGDIVDIEYLGRRWEP